MNSTQLMGAILGVAALLFIFGGGVTEFFGSNQGKWPGAGRGFMVYGFWLLVGALLVVAWGTIQRRHHPDRE